jgi:hypothetical protein
VDASGPSDTDYGVIMDDYSDENLDRAAEMLEELRELSDSVYGDNELKRQLIYSFQSYAENLIWNASYYNEDWYNNY